MRTRVAAMVSVVLLAAGCGGSGDEMSTSPGTPAPTAADSDMSASDPETTAPTTDDTPAPTDDAPAPTDTTPAPTEDAPAPTDDTTAPTAPAADIPEALQFTAATVGGGRFDAAELAGTPVVFWFWAPWCPQCRREAPLVADLAAQYDGQVEFVGVAGLSGDLDAIEDFVTDHGVDGFPHVDDRDGAVYSRFDVQQQYDMGLVTADGEVEILRGPLTEDQITDAVADLAGG